MPFGFYQLLNLVYSCTNWSKFSVLYSWPRKIMDVGTFSFRWILPFWYFCFLLGDKASLALSPKRKQKYQNGNTHRKLKVPTSEREGNCQTRARAPPARDAWRKFTEIYGIPRAAAARALCIDFLAAKYTIQLYSILFIVLNLVLSVCL